MDNFALKEAPLAELQDGWIRVDNKWLSVDPYMRGRMNDVKSYVPPFALGAPMQGGAVGKVVESRSPHFKEGETVFHMQGWCEAAAGPAEAFNKVPQLPVDDHQWLGNLGLTGATGYFGLLRVAEAKEGETVFVSAAAGAVGSAVVQIAKAKGMTVIGSAGGADKCAWVRELGADAAIDYKAGPVVKQLAEAAPKGIDVYFDNVGGDHLDAAFATARQNARFAICGMIDNYNARPAAGLPLHHAGDRGADPDAGFHLHRLSLRDGRLLPGHGRADRGREDRLARDHPRRHRSRPRAFLDLFSGGNTARCWSGCRPQRAAERRRAAPVGRSSPRE